MYCKYCGTQYEEGESCPNCANNAQAQKDIELNVSKEDVSQQMTLLKGDLALWFADCTQKFNLVTTGIFTFASYLFYSISYLCLFGCVGSLTKDLVGTSVKLNSGISFWYGLLSLIVAYGITMLILVVRDLLAKRNIDWFSHLSRCAGVTATISIVMLIGGIAALVSWKLAIIFVLAAIVIRARDYVAILKTFFSKKTSVVTNCVIGLIVGIILALGVLIVSKCAGNLVDGLVNSIKDEFFSFF